MGVRSPRTLLRLLCERYDRWQFNRGFEYATEMLHLGWPAQGLMQAHCDKPSQYNIGVQTAVGQWLEREQLHRSTTPTARTIPTTNTTP